MASIYDKANPNIIDQARAFIPGVQQMFKNVGFNRQQSGKSSGYVPRSLGGSGFVAPAFGTGQAYASDYSAPSPVSPGPLGANTTSQDRAAGINQPAPIQQPAQRVVVETEEEAEV